jgi:hypothetical protein
VRIFILVLSVVLCTCSAPRQRVLPDTRMFKKFDCKRKSPRCQAVKE